MLDHERAPEIVKAALMAQPVVVFEPPHPDLLRFMPALTVTEAGMDRMCDILDRLLAR